MKLTAPIKLITNDLQFAGLKTTLETANRACNWISEQAWDTKTFGQYALHTLTYAAAKQQFGLSAQVLVRCIAKVADAYKLDKKVKRTFKRHSAIAYDDRILSWKLNRNTVSIWTTSGRFTIPFVCGPRQRELLQTRQGESDLVLANNQFFLYATCNVDNPEPSDFDSFLGIDLGVVNIACNSDGEVYSGSTVNNVRIRHRRLRARLQAKQTKSAKRRLKKLSGKERRFAKDVNHCISKQIVQTAQRTNRAIAIEDLNGIRARIRAGRGQRTILHSWSFGQLRAFLEYKTLQVGVFLCTVDPRNTSRTCPSCGCVDQRNRPSQSVFSCIRCGFSGLADVIAAGNISRRASVNTPYAVGLTA